MPKISPPASTVAEYHGSQNPVKILGTFFSIFLYFYISIFLYFFVSSARLQVATEDGFGCMIAQNACFCLVKCLLGVSLMVHHFWASRVRKTKNFHPRDRDFHVKLKR